MIVSKTWFRKSELCLSIYVKQPSILTHATITNHELNRALVELKNYRGFNKLNIFGVYDHQSHQIWGISYRFSGMLGDMSVDISADVPRQNSMHDLNLVNSMALELCNNKW